MNRATRRLWLLAIAGAPIVLGVVPMKIPVRLADDFLRIRANVIDFPFLDNDPLKRLYNAKTVGFIGQFSLADVHRNVLANSVARFALSWDVLAQRFMVTLVTPDKPRPTASNLTKERAEAWCLEQLKVDISHLPADRPFWLRLEIRSEDPVLDTGIVGEPGISISAMVAWFSRPNRPKEVHLVKEDGPFTVSDLRRGHI